MARTKTTISTYFAITYCGPLRPGLMKRVFLFAFSSLLLLPMHIPAQSKGLNPTKTEIRAFLKADRNKDGKLTKREFRTFVRAMAATGQPTAKTIRLFAAYDFAFSYSDRNKDGILTPNEMRAADNRFR